MNSKENQLKLKRAQFEEEYNLYCARSIEKQRQDNADRSGNGICITLFTELESKLIGEYFHGFNDQNGVYIPGYIKIYEDYLRLIKYKISDEYINDLNEELNKYWEKRLMQLETLLKMDYPILNQINFKNDIYEFKLKITFLFEVKRFIAGLRDLKLLNSISLFKRILQIFVPIGATIGFLAGLIQLINAIKDLTK
jgi:hypothetical protein